MLIDDQEQRDDHAPRYLTSLLTPGRWQQAWVQHARHRGLDAQDLHSAEQAVQSATAAVHLTLVSEGIPLSSTLYDMVMQHLVTGLAEAFNNEQGASVRLFNDLDKVFADRQDQMEEGTGYKMGSWQDGIEIQPTPASYEFIFRWYLQVRRTKIKLARCLLISFRN